MRGLLLILTDECISELYIMLTMIYVFTIKQVHPPPCPPTLIHVYVSLQDMHGVYHGFQLWVLFQ